MTRLELEHAIVPPVMSQGMTRFMSLAPKRFSDSIRKLPNRCVSRLKQTSHQ